MKFINMDQFTANTEQLLDFIHKSPSCFHVVANMSQILTEAGFQELVLADAWSISAPGKYFVRQNNSALFAFTLGSTKLAESGFRFIAAHSDSPTFRIKPTPEMLSNGLLRLNTEVYGGAILMSWLDRPLSVAGRVALKTDNPFCPKQVLVDLERPIGVIPSLAIHMNRQVNSGVELNPQNDMPLFVATVNKTFVKEGALLKAVAEKLNVAADEIIDCDLYLYDVQRGCVLGLENNLVLSPKLDDLAMAYAGLQAMLASADKQHNNMLCIFDNEEVGSGTKQGAAAPTLRHILERICEKLSLSTEDFQRMIYHSFMISADQAHALHPNAMSKHDPVLHPVLNGGPVVKYNARQKYMTDADGAAVFISLCKHAGVPYQLFANRSDVQGGSTLGNILTSQLDIRGVDMGNPMLGMHSSRETAGVLDQWYATKVFTSFFSE